MIRVKVYRDGQAVEKRDLRGHDLIIGREKGADIQLPSQAVSRRHARLQKTADGWQVADMGAANGVYVSKSGGEPERVVIQPVSPTDVIIIETFSIKFEEVEDAGTDAGEGMSTFDDNSLETKRTQFISMVDVLEAGESALVMPSSGEGGPVEPSVVVKADVGTWWARLDSAQGHQRVFELKTGTTLVGTGDNCGVRLPSGPSQIVELERNGLNVALARIAKWPFPRVTVEGQSVKNAMLQDGDSFRVGDFEISVFLHQHPSKQAPSKGG